MFFYLIINQHAVKEVTSNLYLMLQAPYNASVKNLYIFNRNDVGNTLPVIWTMYVDTLFYHIVQDNTNTVIETFRPLNSKYINPTKLLLLKEIVLSVLIT